MNISKIINLNQLTWMLNIALAGLVFSIFSLIYNGYFIYYGFITFTYGLIAHFLDEAMNNFKSSFIIYYIIQFALIITWIIAILLIYK